MENFELIARFKGGEAEQHRIPAYEGAQSLQGISRSFVLINHYFSVGEIRKRAPFSRSIRVYLEPPRPRSLDAVLTFVIESDLVILAGGGSLIGSVTAGLLTEAIKAIFLRVIGRHYKTNNDDLLEIEDSRPGDIEALVDAVEPSIKLAHTAINQGSQNIIIIHGDNNIINFDSESKEYVNYSGMSDIEELQHVSVGSLNVNTGYGRVWLHDLGKTVPFSVIKDPDPGTYSALSHSLDRYANKLPSDIEIRFLRVTAPDGRTKKFLILGAKRIEPENE